MFKELLDAVFANVAKSAFAVQKFYFLGGRVFYGRDKLNVLGLSARGYGGICNGGLDRQITCFEVLHQLSTFP
jgi:hypothetical protein